MDASIRIILGDSRVMPEVAADTVDLVVTSPPYWHIKDYGAPGQIGYGQSLHEYFCDLFRVWQECYRVLRPGGRLCINVGDQFARAAVYGRYKIIPLHAEIIGQGEELGFDFLGGIIWRKKTTMNTTGGAPVMGSYPFPPNGLVEIDYEYILIFKKPGPGKKVAPDLKEASGLTREEWKEYFSGHWQFGGTRQRGHEAMFPEELPRRLIRMFTFAGDMVLDPFLGSGTTLKAARDLGRRGLGYEVNEDFVGLIKEKLGIRDGRLFGAEVEIFTRPAPELALPPLAWVPRLQDAQPLKETRDRDFTPRDLVKVVGIVDQQTLHLADGRTVSFLGVAIAKQAETLAYLTARILGKEVRVHCPEPAQQPAPAYIYLKNRLLVNAYLIKAGLARCGATVEHRWRRKFLACEGR